VAERVLVRDFLRTVVEAMRPLLPPELLDFQERYLGSLAQVYYDEPTQHFEVWLRRADHKVELGLHFESRDRAVNARMLERFADEIIWIKAELGERTEAEPWDRGWSRVHQVVPMADGLTPELRDSLAERLARFIELLEPFRREAARS
jgi:hypothetical protein